MVTSWGNGTGQFVLSTEDWDANLNSYWQSIIIYACISDGPSFVTLHLFWLLYIQPLISFNQVLSLFIVDTKLQVMYYFSNHELHVRSGGSFWKWSSSVADSFGIVYHNPVYGLISMTSHQVMSAILNVKKQFVNSPNLLEGIPTSINNMLIKFGYKVPTIIWHFVLHWDGLAIH